MNERSAMAHLIQYAIDGSCTISVWDSELWSLTKSTDKQAIIEEVNGVDAVCNLRIRKGEDVVGTFAVCAGLEGEEDVIDYIVSDWSNAWDVQFNLYLQELDGE